MKNIIIVLFAVLMISLSSCLPPPDDFENPDEPIVEDPELLTAIVTKISASSHDGNVPENVLDDNLSTRWSASGKGQYITLELNESILIDNIGIAWYFGDERYANYEILTSTDGINWITRVNSTTVELTLEQHKDTINVNASYIRIIGYENSQSSWNSITSIHVNGKNPEYMPTDSSVDPPSDPPSNNDSDRHLSLRGDPNFDINHLSSTQRVHYEKLLLELNDPSNKATMKSLIDRDDNFVYSRTIHGYVQSVLNVFRVTGDLRLLDHVDDITERMRENLDYGWRDTLDGTDGSWNNYLMWVYRNTQGTSTYGKDIKINDLKVNAMIAMVAYTLDQNRNFTSPTGKDYGAHADFWKDYLVNHFEAKWRERSGKSTGHPITTPHSDSHSFTNYVKGSYYMWKITGDQGWYDESVRTADILWNHEIRDVSHYDNEPFSAYVWMSNIQWQSSSRNYLQSTSYASSNYGDAVTFHFEGFHKWADPDRMKSFARSITEFQYTKADGTRYSSPSDILSNGISQDIGGNVMRAGIPLNHEVPRRTARAYVNYQTSMMSPWDASGEIAEVAKVVQDKNPDSDTTRLAAALFLYSYYHE